MFFPEPVAAFAHVAGALRPGGRLALVVWQPLEANPWWAVPARVAPGPLGTTWAPPATGQPGPFALADPERVRSVLGAAGFADVVVQGATSAARLGEETLDEDVVRLLQTGPMRTAWDQAGAEARSAAVAAVREAVAPFRSHDGGYALPGAVWVVTARRP
jgi:hypothetical protein